VSILHIELNIWIWEWYELDGSYFVTRNFITRMIQLVLFFCVFTTLEYSVELLEWQMNDKLETTWETVACSRFCPWICLGGTEEITQDSRYLAVTRTEHLPIRVYCLTAKSIHSVSSHIVWLGFLTSLT
jgi:hypothetical protein